LLKAFLGKIAERRRRPPRYRAILVRNTLPLLERCETVDAMKALLEEVRKGLGLETLQVRFLVETAGVHPDGIREVEVSDPNPPRDSDFVRDNGVPSWTGRVEILSPIRTSNFEIRNGGEAVVLGDVLATKPAWKRRRTSENDDELLHLLADGLAQWLSRRAASGS